MVDQSVEKGVSFALLEEGHSILLVIFFTDSSDSVMQCNSSFAFSKCSVVAFIHL